MGKGNNQQQRESNFPPLSPAEQWLSANYNTLPDEEWVAISDEGLVSHFPEFMDLMFDLVVKKITLFQVILTKVNKSGKFKKRRKPEWEEDDE